MTETSAPARASQESGAAPPSRVAATALERSYRAERLAVGALGVLAVLAGTATLLLTFGVFGTARAGRALLDPEIVRVLGSRPELSRAVALATGVVLVAAGAAWAVRTLRPEPRPDLLLESAPGATLTVTSKALARAVREDLEALDGVAKATVRSVGSVDEPALRLTVWLGEGSDLQSVWQALDGQVLHRAREALGLPTLPAAIRFELGAARGTRVR